MYYFLVVKTKLPHLSPKPEKSYSLKFKSFDIIEFKKITKESTIEIDQENIENYFGTRIKSITPVELHFDDNTLTIIKNNDITEEYVIKWDNKQLFIYEELDDSWKYCGRQDEEDHFILNIGLYSLYSETEQRTLHVIGQDYSFTSYDKVSTDKNQNATWLKLELTFK